MKFAHFSDVHLGSWSDDEELMKLSFKAFDTAIDKCIEENVDFILIAGDLFDIPMPSYEILLSSVKTLIKCKEKGIRVYVVPGSHDYSPTHKSFIQVMDVAGIVIDAAKMKEINGKYLLECVTDSTGAKIFGVMGKSGSTEHEYFEKLDRSIENTDGYKILLFHSAIEEFKPDKLSMMPGVPLKNLPQGFDYYATGHIHREFKSGNILFPGVLFPTETTEFENYNSGIFIIDTNEKEYRKIPIKLFGVVVIEESSENAIELKNKINAQIESKDLQDKMLIIKAYGTLESGKISDLKINEMVSLAKSKGAFSVKKNFNQLKQKSKVFIKNNFSSQEDIESFVIKSSLKNTSFDNKTAESLIKELNDSKQEGESVAVYEKRIIENAMKVLGI